MRRLVGLTCILMSTAALGAYVGSHPAGAQTSEPYENKTLKLRSGPVTLQPTVAPPPAGAPTPTTVPAPSAGGGASGTPPPPAKKRGILAPNEEPVPAFPTATPGGIELKATDKIKRKLSYLSRKLGSERVILSFERRLTNAERLQLTKRGIVIGDYLGDTAYTARVRQTGSEELVRASQDINSIQHVTAFDQSNTHIKIDPNLAARVAAPKEPTRDAAPPPPPPAGAAHNGPTIETTPRGSESKAATGTVVVEVWPDVDLEQVRRELAPLGEIQRVSPRTRKIEMSISDYKAIEAIAKLKGVKFVAPSYGIRTQNTRVARNIGMAAAAEPQHALTGDGVRIGIWDGGHVAANHPSFTGRLAIDLQREGITRRRDDRHATHVAGTIAGSGDYVLPVTSADGSRQKPRENELPAFGPELTVKARRATASAETASAPQATPKAASEGGGDAEPRYPGMAAKAAIHSYDFLGAAEELIDLLTTKPDAIDVMNNSWGLNLDPATDPTSCSQLAAYAVLDAPDFDAVVSGEKNGLPIRRIPIVFAAGNARNDGVCGMSTAAGFPNYRSVVAPGTAKNVITVGAIDADTNGMTEFSSWGPTANGRIKPDVVAPGCRALKDGDQGIVSTVPANTIGRSCGTSMAAPAVTGVIALMIEKMVKLGQKKADVLPSTYKALLIHGAEDLGRAGPDFEFGYGRVRLGPTLKLMDDRAFQQAKVEREGQVATLGLTAAQGARQLKVTLVWDDRPTGIFTEEALSNDLDLVVIGPDGRQHLPFLLNAVPGKEKEAAVPGVDRLNVVEQVIVSQPAAGAWRVEVRGTKIGSPTGGQTYSLVTSVE